MEFRVAGFKELNLDTLYSILRLRSEVFVIEQQCIWLDIDGHDKDAIHIWSVDENTVTAYSRIFKPGNYYPEASIGRVVVHTGYRLKGAGRKLMAYSIDQVYATWGVFPIKIMAQSYMRSFYESFGFVVCSDEFDDFGIMHYYMIKK